MDEQSERLVRVETKLDALITLNDTRTNHIETRLSALEEAFKWVGRVVIGAVLVAVLALVIIAPQIKMVRYVSGESQATVNASAPKPF